MKIVKGIRICRSASIRLRGGIDDVFPLFGPVREKEWATNWDPQIIFSSTHLTDLHMIFRTKASNSRESFYTWILTQFAPEQYLLEYTVFTPLRIWFINVRCREVSDFTEATVTYTYTSTSEEGAALNWAGMDEIFADDLKDWERAINDHLATLKLSVSPK